MGYLFDENEREELKEMVNAIKKRAMARFISVMVAIALLFSSWTVTSAYAETVSSPDGMYDVDISATTIKEGEKITFTARGDNQDSTGNYHDEVRYVPISWAVRTPEYGTFSEKFEDNKYTQTIPITKNATLEVSFFKQTYRNSYIPPPGWENGIEDCTIKIPITVIEDTGIKSSCKINVPSSVVAGETVNFTAQGTNQSGTDVRCRPVSWNYENLSRESESEDGLGHQWEGVHSSYNEKFDTDFPGEYNLSVTFSKEVLRNTTWDGYESFEVVTQITVKPRPANLIFVSGFDKKILKDIKSTIYLGKPYGKLPKFRVKGWKFLGFYTKSYGGKKVTAKTIAKHSIEDDDGNYDPGTIKVYAHWSKKVKVKFETNGATIKGKKNKTIEYNENKYKKYGKLPTATKAGYKFLGWYTKKKGGWKVTKNTRMADWENHTLYAHFKKPAKKKKGGRIIWIITWG
jgi:uncharacterized repeat protein (TIGR02543 family)